MPRRLLADISSGGRLHVPGAPHLVGCHGEDGDGVPSLHLSHDRVLPHAAQQLNTVNRCVCVGEGGGAKRRAHVKANGGRQRSGQTSAGLGCSCLIDKKPEKVP